MGNTVNGSTVQMRSLRFRTDCPALGWANKGPKYGAEKLRIEGLLQAAGLDSGSRTTRGLAWGLADPNDANSTRIEIPAKKGWICSVEDATIAHLNPIQSPVASGFANSAQPAPFPAATTFNGQQYGPQLLDHDSDATISDWDAGDENGPKPPSGRKRKLIAPEESAAKRRNTSDGSNPGPVPIWIPARGWESQPAPSLHGRHQAFEEDLSPSGYPHPEEVPRAPSIAFPLEYQQWLAADLHNAADLRVFPTTADTDDYDVLPGVLLNLEASGFMRAYILYGDRWLGLKTPQERQNLTEKAAQLLAGFFPAGSEQRFEQLGYLLDPEQACFGFEDRNGQWGETNWDLNNTSNIHYHVSQIEARTLLVAQLGRQQVQ
jgi:hypothetical protein